MESFVARTARDRWQAFMDAAADRVQVVARESAGSEDGNCARSVLQTPTSWNLWERELGTALRPVAGCRSRTRQLHALREASFAWIHRAAPFRYLRDQQVRGVQRRRLVAALHGPLTHYDLAMVAEHERYRRSVCHGFCASHLGRFLLDERLYGESMRRYEALYMDYFRAFGGLISGAAGPAAAESQRLLPLMKRQLAEIRQAILDYPDTRSWLRRQSILRTTHGDTQLLRRLDFNLH